nr:hypothetical protein [Flavivirga sp. MEBiC07777]
MTLKKLYGSLLLCTIGSIGLMALLFVFTKKSITRDNSFKRGFLYNSPEKIHELDLEYNGYYIAGADQEQIYLGSPGSPLFLTVVDSALQSKEVIHLSMDQDSLPMRSPQLRVVPPYFFLTDGTIPYILRGNTKDWKAHSMLDDPLYFTNAQPIDSVTLAIRAISNKTNEFVLGTIKLEDSATMRLSHELLQKQVDGLFDVDGMLQYNQQRKQMVYTYRYRNQYIVANDSLQLQFLGKTIDTISQAQIQVGTIASKNKHKMAAPALTVNRNSATSGDYLFINSRRLGQSESLVLWEQSSLIDVYNMEKDRYEFSFYVEDIDENKLKSFFVLHDKFIGLIGNHMVTYQLGDHFKQKPPSTIMAQKQKTDDQK